MGIVGTRCRDEVFDETCVVHEGNCEEGECWMFDGGIGSFGRENKLGVLIGILTVK